ncbi:MAG TPA: peptide chain release factor N(5)-glutamine methyltransferase [Syntrophomonadaceae bacterium]|nr:peptide chain release factor N(5)-glutamine methyltransferase [Syntrophomonadaceae bacterium]
MPRLWKISDLLSWTTNYFNQKGIDSPRLEAEVLLARVLSRDRVYLYANFDQPVGSVERERFREFIQRRLAGEPSAYIVGYKEFMSLNFKVNSSVLIPRPDTEVLVESVVEVAPQSKGIKICDVGTGAGTIAVSLAYYLPNAIIYATDISKEALAIAKENALNNGVEVNFSQGDLLRPVQEAGEFEIITANLPYIAAEEYEGLDIEVRDFEPKMALLAEGDGLDLYRQLIPAALNLLSDGGFLFFEISSGQGKSALELAKEYFAEAELRQDYAGRDRLIKARKGQ